MSTATSNSTPLSTVSLAAAGRTLGDRNRGMSSSQTDFSEVMTRARDAGQTPAEQARAAAEQFVAIAMVQPLLTQLRQNNQAAAPFAPTQGEKQFQSLFDAQIAQRITKAKRFPLVDAVAEQLIKRLQAKAEHSRSGTDAGTPAL